MKISNDHKSHMKICPQIFFNVKWLLYYIWIYGALLLLSICLFVWLLVYRTVCLLNEVHSKWHTKFVQKFRRYGKVDKRILTDKCWPLHTEIRSVSIHLNKNHKLVVDHRAALFFLRAKIFHSFMLPLQLYLAFSILLNHAARVLFFSVSEYSFFFTISFSISLCAMCERFPLCFWQKLSCRVTFYF